MFVGGEGDCDTLTSHWNVNVNCCDIRPEMQLRGRPSNQKDPRAKDSTQSVVNIGVKIAVNPQIPKLWKRTISYGDSHNRKSPARIQNARNENDARAENWSNRWQTNAASQPDPPCLCRFLKHVGGATEHRFSRNDFSEARRLNALLFTGLYRGSG